MERDEDDYTYLEWITYIRMFIDMACDAEIRRISHNSFDERPHALINTIQKCINKFENEIPDEITN